MHKINVRAYINWSDLWIGASVDSPERKLYVCLLPCCVLEFDLPQRYYEIVSGYARPDGIRYVIGRCTDDGKYGVLREEPHVTFRRISREDYEKERDT